MKKIVIALLALMGFAVVAVLFAGTAFASVTEDGFVVPADADLVNQISGDGEPIELTALHYEDVIYRSAAGYYVGNERNLIDLTYPMYLDGGAAVRFWDEDNWMITAGVELYNTFDGMYISEGISYNSDRTQADDGEFIMIALDNGLYMNAQYMVLSSPLGDRYIPANSVLWMSEDAISWYGPEQGILRHGREEAVFSAKITIGDHTYLYLDLLDALGLIRKAVEKNDGAPVDSGVENQADAILNGGSNQSGSTGSQNLNQDSAGDEDEGNSSGNAAGTGSQNGGMGSNAAGGGEGSDSATSGGSQEGSGNPEEGGESSDGGSGSGDGAGSSSKPPEDQEGPSQGGNSPGTGDGGSGEEGSEDNSGEEGPPNTDTPDDGFLYPDNGGEGGSEGGNNSGEDTGSSSGGTQQYREPKITIQNIQPWSYAIGVDLEVNDPAGMLYRGVAFSIYRNIQGSGKTSQVTDPVTQKTYTVYSKDDYTGRSKALGRTRYSSESLALSTLDPGTTVYLQYSYRYWQQYKDETGADQLRRTRIYSDLYEVQLPTVADGGVKPLAADWSLAFAGSPSAIQLDNMSLRNTSGYVSDYDDETEAFRFDQFKLNTLPYVDHLDITLTKEGTITPVVVKVPSSTLRQAQTAAGASFLSRMPALDPNSKYTFTVTAKDRSGKDLPLQWPSQSNVLYTRKTTPTVVISEVSNTMEALELKIRVEDPDGALRWTDENGSLQTHDLRLTMAVTQTGELTKLFGTWDTDEISAGGADVDTLRLINPSHGKEYTLSLESLAFSRMYTVQVKGDYSAQPSGVTSPMLPVSMDQNMGTMNIYTASLQSGRIGFDTNYADLLDTSATIHATMNEQTTVEILPLLDALRLVVKDGAGNVVSTVVLDKDDLDANVVLEPSEYVPGENFLYDRQTGAIELKAASGYSPRVLLYGVEGQVRQTPWESLCIHLEDNPDNPGEQILSKPMQLRFYLPSGTLEHNTTYTYSLEAVVYKSGEEAQIPVAQTGNRFTTKKTIPVPYYDEFFLAADRAEFVNLRFHDPDGTILDNGLIRAYLYYNTDDSSTLLSVQELRATKDMNSGGKTLAFTDLIAEGRYSLKFVAPSYNDAEGYDSYDKDHLLVAYDIVAGSKLDGSLQITNMTLAADLKTFDTELSVKVEDKEGYLGKPGEKAQVQLLIERSDSMEDPDYQIYRPTKEYENPVVLDLERRDGPMSLDVCHLLKDQPVNDSWRLTLTTSYRGSEITLDQTTFHTDGGSRIANSHAEMIRYQKETNPVTGRRDLNILIGKDFVQDQNEVVQDFYGNIDFQGHVVTKGDNITTTAFLYINRGSTISNLVYDYPRQNNYQNKGNIVKDSGFMGTLENLVVRTHGNVYIRDSGYLIGSTISSTGVLRNFIVYANGDLEIEGPGYRGALIAGSCSGIIENGIVYGKGGSGLITRDLPAGGGLFGHMGSTRMSNIFILMDSWYQTGSSAKLISHPTTASGHISNIYTVGDFYSISPGDGKHRRTPQESQYVVQTSARAGIFEDIWAITNLDYTNTGSAARFLTLAKSDVLRDQQWQESMLGSGFETQNSVAMGFYPRLILPACMQKYQEYIYLPAVSNSVLPQIVTDGWADEKIYGAHDLAKGHVLLRMKNNTNASIKAIAIEGLTTDVVAQSPNGDFYDVILAIEVNHEAADAVKDRSIGYASTHQVQSITYAMGGSAEQTIPSTYVMKRVELWKSVSTIQDWAAINRHMGWNYKLERDIAFDPDSVGMMGSMTIDGSSNWDGGTAFTGKIDGQEHVVSGMRINGVANASVIYQANGAQIRNLFFKDVELTHDPAKIKGYAGIIGYAVNSSIDNVRVQNSKITGGGYVGGLVGYHYTSSMNNCSIVDSQVGDVASGKALYLGGLAGRQYTGSIERSYIRDVRVTVDDTTVVSGAGGLVGFSNGAIRDCYSHGILTVEGNYVGAITGSGTGANIDRCWNYMDIRHSGGNYVAGVTGTRDAGTSRNVTLGNISTTADSLDRTGAAKSYVYAGQIVTGFGASDAGPKESVMLTAAELGIPSIWQDTVAMGTSFNYGPVANGEAPLLKSDASRAEWRQISIPLPGLGASPSLKIETEVYRNEKYQVVALLSHPKKTNAELFPRNDLGKITNLELTLDGMDISDAAQEGENPSAIVTVQPLNGDTKAEQTQITITTDRFVKALDVYTLIAKYNDGRNQELSAVVEYKDYVSGLPHHNFWEVADLAGWNQLMPEHGTTGENFRITNIINFGAATTSYRNLVFNRLEGKENSRDTCGFANLPYYGLSTSTPWIKKVAIGMKDLSFTSMTFDHQGSDAAQEMTGAIISCGPVERIKLDGITIKGSGYNRKYVGFISNVAGPINDVVLTNTRIEDNSTSTTTGDNCGTLVAYTKSDVSNIVATNVSIYAPYINRVGGVIGYVENNNDADVNTVTIHGAQLTGRDSVGAVAGYIDGRSVSNCSVTGTTNYKSIHGRTAVGGIVGTSSVYRESCVQNHVTGLDITADAGSAGGAAGGTSWFRSENSSVTNCTIKGTSFVGGFKAGGPSYLWDVKVIRCTILNTATEAKAYDAMAVGGLQGNYNGCEGQHPQMVGCVIRDCEISGPANVGGAIGSIVRINTSDTYRRVYVTTDVTVTATDNTAGGLIGVCDTMGLEYCASGATVSAPKYAGGIVGRIIPRSSALMTSLVNVYFGGTVTASREYAGGIVGVLDDPNLRFDDNTLSNCAVLGSVTAPKKISSWVNNTSSVTPPGTGTVYIWEGTKLNGETIADLELVANATEKNLYLAPPRDLSKEDLTISDDIFQDAEFYSKTLKFSEDHFIIDTYLDAGYMPGVTSYRKTTPPPLDITKDTAVLIPLPSGESAPTELAVYAAGINLVNIELPTAPGEAGESVAIDGVATTLTERVTGIAFQDSVKVNGVDYEDLSRKVMTYGTGSNACWYYIDTEGAVQWGNDTEAKGAVTGMAENEVAQHLWQGMVRTTAGTYYTLSGGEATLVETAPASTAAPFWHSSRVSIDTYYYYSTYSGAVLPFRAYDDGREVRTIKASQGVAYDGVFARYDADNKQSYFVKLTAENCLESSGDAEMKLSNLTNAGIGQMSNSQNYSGNVLVTWYGPGKVQVINFTTGTRLVNTVSTAEQFVSFVMFALDGLFGEVTGEGLYLDSSMQAGMDQREQMIADGLMGMPTMDAARGEDYYGYDPDGQAGESSADTATQEAEAGNPGDQEGQFDSGIGSGTGVNEAGEGLSGSTAEPGTETGAGEASSAPGAIGGGGEGIGGSEPGAGGSGDTSGASGNGITPGMVPGTAAGGGGAMTTGEALKALFGDGVVLYSEETGRYELIDTQSLAQGEPRLAADVHTKQKEEADSEKTTEPSGEDSFQVKLTPGRSLFAAEEQGFLFIAIAAGVAVLGLLLLFLNILNKRKR